MAGSDASIYSMIRPPDVGPGPLVQAGQLMQIRNLMGQGQLQDLQRQKLGTDIEEEQQFKELFRKYPDGKVPINELFGISPTRATAYQKSALESEKTRGDIDKTKLESQALQIKQIRDIAAQVTGDADLSYAREQVARIIGPDRAAQIPFFNQPFSPESQQKVIMSVDEKIKRMSPTLHDTDLGGKRQFVNPYTAAPVGEPLEKTELPGAKQTRAQQTTTNEGKIRDDYNKASQDFVKVRDAHQRVVVSAKDPSAAGDLSLIFNYMKVLDPGSTVREGEFATAQNSGSIPDIIRAKYNKVIAGERLAPDVRADFLDRSAKLYNAAQTNQEKLEKQYTDLSTRSGADPRNVVLPQRLTQDAPQPTQADIDAELRKRGVIR